MSKPTDVQREVADAQAIADAERRGYEARIAELEALINKLQNDAVSFRRKATKELERKESLIIALLKTEVPKDVISYAMPPKDADVEIDLYDCASPEEMDRRSREADLRIAEMMRPKGFVKVPAIEIDPAADAMVDRRSREADLFRKAKGETIMSLRAEIERLGQVIHEQKLVVSEQHRRREHAAKEIESLRAENTRLEGQFADSERELNKAWVESDRYLTALKAIACKLAENDVWAVPMTVRLGDITFRVTLADDGSFVAEEVKE